MLDSVSLMETSFQIAILAIVCTVVYFTLDMGKVGFSKKNITLTEKSASSINVQSDDQLIAQLQKRFPPHIICLPGSQEFRSKVDVHWAQQEREKIPSCVISPETVEDLSAIIKFIKQEYDQQRKDGKVGGLFAVRSGGHNTVAGAASIENGVVIDLGQLKSIKISEKRDTVDIGAGARWIDVTKVLDAEDLAVVGGRASKVGVGGLTLGGGISYFSPRFGMVCSNVISYEVVLASGSIVTASATSHPRLWRALKGGLNNFGVVTKFTLPAFPSSNFWSGWVFMPPFQPHKAMAAFHEFAARRTNYDPYAAPPILVFSWIYPLGIRVVTCNLAYTKKQDKKSTWPDCFMNSGFRSLWRFHSTCKIQSLTSMTDEMDSYSPPGLRQLSVTTTIKNCLDTMKEAYVIMGEASAAARRHLGFKSWFWGIVFQPMSPDMLRKGNGNCLGLADEEDVLINIQFSIKYKDASLDVPLTEAAKKAVNDIEAMAKRRQTYHRYKYANYCATWQNPFGSYREENLKFLRDVSKEVDPDQLFQVGCPGGFKIWGNDVKTQD